MLPEMTLLLSAAIAIAVIHTLTGPDHYVPFIFFAKSRGWSIRKTIWWTIVCGCAHVWSSVLLGIGAAALGWNFAKYKWLDGIRGGIAGWGMIFFGIFYLVWGVIKAKKNIVHKHFDVSDNGELVVFEHNHKNVFDNKERYKVTPWVLFLIFLLGPCEPMIPLLYYPGAKNSISGIVALVAVYTAFTLIIMLTMVVGGIYGIGFFKSNKFEKYMPVVSGATLLICGFGMVYLGW